MLQALSGYPLTTITTQVISYKRILIPASVSQSADYASTRIEHSIISGASRQLIHYNYYSSYTI